MDGEAKFLQQVETLKSSYIAALPVKISAINQLWEKQKDTSRYNEGLIKELINLMHTIAGSAGTFGFTNISTEFILLQEELNYCIKKKTISPKNQIDIDASLQRARCIRCTASSPMTFTT